MIATLKLNKGGARGKRLPKATAEPTSPLLDWATTHARTNDPETSHAAASKSQELARRHHIMIYARLREVFPGGLTYEEIANGIGLEKHCVGKRMVELQRDGHARTEGERLLSSGRRGRIWIAVMPK